MPRTLECMSIYISCLWPVSFEQEPVPDWNDESMCFSDGRTTLRGHDVRSTRCRSVWHV